MSSVDNRIVSMQFDNAAFESKLSTTLASLDQLSKKLSMVGAGKGLQDVGTAANNIDMSKLASNVDNIRSKFSVMGVAGFTAISNITSSIMSMATNFVKTDILAPIISGGTTRAQNIEQAKFQFRGLGIDVNKAMQSSLDAVKGTAYGLGDAAKAAAQFGASGIGAGDKMTQSLRAIAGTAAMTGSQFGDMAQIFTSSAASGKITNMDLMQFATRGLNAAAAYAKQTGLTEAQVHQMASKGTLDYTSFAAAMDKAFGAHATQANETYSGSLANMHAAMSRLGASFIGPQEQQQRDLFNALTPVIDNVTKALQPLITAFLDIRGTINTAFIDKLKNLDLSNFTKAIPNFAEGLRNSFKGVSQLFGVIKDAFRDIFPPSTTSALIAFSEGFKSFTEHLKMGVDTVSKVKSIFEGFFSVFSIGWAILKGIVGVVVDVFKALSPVGSGFLDIGAKGGSMLTDLKKALVDGGVIKDFFDKLGGAIVGAIGFMKVFKDKVSEFFSTGIVNDAVTGSVDRVGSRLDSIAKDAEKVKGVWQNMMGHLQGVFKVLDNIWNYVRAWFSQLGSKLAKAFGPTDFSGVVDIINVGLLGGILALLSKFMAGGLNIGLQGGFFTKINQSLTGVTRSLQAMQTNLKADALLKIAVAMALLTASIVALSLIDSDKLAKALVAITIGFGELIGAMTLMDKIFGSTWGAVKLGILSGALIGLSVSILLLAAAMKLYSTMSWEDLAKGLAGMAGGLIVIAGAMQLMPSGISMTSQSVGLMAVGVALDLIAVAMKIFATMSWEDLRKGLNGVGGGLLVIAAALHLMPSGLGMVAQGVGLTAVGVALNLIAASMLIFARMSWEELGKGITGVGVGLLVIAGAMQLMPLNLPITATGILILSAALSIMAKAVQLMGKNDLETLAKGIGAIAALLLVLVIAMNAMDGSITGAASLVIVAGALAILTKVMTELAKLSLGELAASIGAIAAVLTVLGLAGLILEPVIPALMGLGVALTLIGGGFALFGLGAMLVISALDMLAKSGEIGAKAIVKSLKIILDALPDLAAGVALAVVKFAEDILKQAPLLLKLVTVLLGQILDTIIKLTPKLAEALASIITEGLKLIRKVFPDVVTTGFDMLMALLKGIRDNIGEITNVVVDIITNFLDALSKKVPQIVDSVFNLIGAVIAGVLDKLVDIGSYLIPKGLELLGGLLTGLWNALPDIWNWFVALPGQILGWLGDLLGFLVPKGLELIGGLLTGLWNALPDIWNFISSLPGKILGWLGDLLGFLIPKGLELIGGLLTGLWNALPGVMGWIISLPGKILGWLAGLAGLLLGKGLELLGGLLNGLINALPGVMSWIGGLPGKILNGLGNLGATLVNVGGDLITGLWNGIWAMKDWLLKKLESIVNIIPGPIRKFLGIGSPSKLFHGFGVNIVQGLINGMDSMKDELVKTSSVLGDHLTNGFNLDSRTMNSIFKSLTEQLGNMDNFNPVITPVLDLTKVKLASNDIQGYLNIASLTPDVSLQQARLISTTTDLAKSSSAPTPSTGPTTVTFEQSIYAPTALSTNDIYRNTKSQIVLAKEELGIS